MKYEITREHGGIDYVDGDSLLVVNAAYIPGAPLVIYGTCKDQFPPDGVPFYFKPQSWSRVRQLTPEEAAKVEEDQKRTRERFGNITAEEMFGGA